MHKLLIIILSILISFSSTLLVKKRDLNSSESLLIRVSKDLFLNNTNTNIESISGNSNNTNNSNNKTTNTMMRLSLIHKLK
jgi:hypothetical protein